MNPSQNLTPNNSSQVTNTSKNVWRLYIVCLLLLLLAIIIFILSSNKGYSPKSPGSMASLLLVVIGYYGALILSIVGIIVHKKLVRKVASIITVIVFGILTLVPFIAFI